MKQRKSNPILALSIGVVALFLAGFLMLVVFGAHTYRSAVESQYANMDARGLTAYLAAAVKANDSRGTVSVRDSDYGALLAVSDAESGYELRYYRYEGSLVEELAPVGAALTPDSAQPIGPTEVFTLSERAGKVLTITTDAGRTVLTIRCGEEAGG